jgi:hypothetical protein
MSIKEILMQILTEISQIKNDTLPTDRLWTVTEVAKYWQVHENIARDILKRPGAPKNIGVTGHGRYEPQDIKAYKPGK